LDVFDSLAQRKQRRLMSDCAVPNTPDSGVCILTG
jgi:hypothetical protein